VAIGGGTSFVTVSAGAFHTCGISTLGETFCWGSNQHGQLGDGTNSERHWPVRVSGQND
jgi:alpha-tubulin suppressor-like RCC1 family protein